MRHICESYQLIIFMHKWPSVQYPGSGRTDKFNGLGHTLYAERTATCGSLGSVAS
jgi:hypothetical protein